MSSSNCCFLTCIQVSQEAGKNFPQFVVIHTVKGFGVVNEAEAGIEIAGRSINNLKYADDRKQRDTKEPLDEGERGE